jgi:chromosome segregation ATPase
MNGTPGGSASEQIRRARQQLKDRFSSIEKSILSELSTFHAPPPPVPAADEARLERLQDQNREMLQEIHDLKARLEKDQTALSAGEAKIRDLQGRLEEALKRPAVSGEDALISDELKKKNVMLEGELRSAKELLARHDQERKQILSELQALRQKPSGGSDPAELLQLKSRNQMLEGAVGKLESEVQSLRERTMAVSSGADSAELSRLQQRNQMLEDAVKKLEEEIETRVQAPAASAPSPELEQENARLKAQLKNAHDMSQRYLREIEQKSAQLKEQTEILARSRAARQNQSQEIPASMAENARIKGENIRMKEQVLAMKMKRLHSAQLWRRMLGAYRKLKKAQRPPSA